MTGSATWSRAPRVVTILVGGLLAAGSDAARADYKKDFADGVRAADLGKWEEAEQLMRQAIREQPTPGGKIRLEGAFSREYIPYYYLGLARFRLGDCLGALELWEQSEQYGTIRRERREHVRLLESRQSCLDQVLPPLLATARGTIAKGRELARDLQSALAEGDGLAGLENRRHTLSSRLDEAESKLATGESQRSLPDASQGADLARITVEDLQQLETDWKARIALSLESVVRAARSHLEAAAAAEAEVRGLEDVVGPAWERKQFDSRFEAVSRELQRARELLETGERATSASSVRAAESAAKAALDAMRKLRDDLRREPPASTRRPGEDRQPPQLPPPSPPPSPPPAEPPPIAPPPAAVDTAPPPPPSPPGGLPEPSPPAGFDQLSRGIEAYFDARYERALELLEDLSFPTHRQLGFQACLLRTATLFALFVRSGEQDEKAGTLARDAASACRKSHPGQEPPARYFSPRFARFFATGG